MLTNEKTGFWKGMSTKTNQLLKFLAQKNLQKISKDSWGNEVSDAGSLQEN